MISSDDESFPLWLDLKNPPKSFMYRLCNVKNPSQLSENADCIRWFNAATNYCAGVLRVSTYRLPIWLQIQNWFIPKQDKLNKTEYPINYRPQSLTTSDCSSLLVNMARDYVIRAPRYGLTYKTLQLVWVALWLLMALLSLAVTTATVYGFYKRYLQPYIERRENILAKLAACASSATSTEIDAAFVANRQMRHTRYETSHLDVIKGFEPKQIFKPNGNNTTLVLRCIPGIGIQEVLIFGNSVVRRLFRKIWLRSQSLSPEYEERFFKQVLSFLNQYKSKNLFVALRLDEEGDVFAKLIEDAQKLSKCINNGDYGKNNKSHTGILSKSLKKKPTDNTDTESEGVKSSQLIILSGVVKCSGECYRRATSEIPTLSDENMKTFGKMNKSNTESIVKRYVPAKTPETANKSNTKPNVKRCTPPKVVRWRY